MELDVPAAIPLAETYRIDFAPWLHLKRQEVNRIGAMDGRWPQWLLDQTPKVFEELPLPDSQLANGGACS